MRELSAREIKRMVQEGYTSLLHEHTSCCGNYNSCCGAQEEGSNREAEYDPKDLQMVPEEANLGLGCGNPLAIARLKEGQVVVDLGCGAGLDCFLAAQKVGERGRVIGVDMTPEMIHRARQIARDHGYQNVEFRLGEIEHLPLADSSCDVVISNCVINLSPQKDQVFQEAFRILRNGGQLVISDIVREQELPPWAKNEKAYIACIAGSIPKEEYLNAIQKAGFTDVKIATEKPFIVCKEESEEIAFLLSITVIARKAKI